MDYVNLDGLGLIQISGSSSAEFLQGQLSCDIREVNTTQSRLTTHCNFKGRILASGRLLMIEADYYLIVSASLVDYLLKELSKYAAFYNVVLKDFSQSLTKIGLASLDLADQLHTTFSLDTIADNEVYIVETSRFVIIPGVLPRAIVLGVTQILQEAYQVLKPFSYWEGIDITGGIGQVTAETRGLFTPHQLNYHLKGGISFTKGCYTGQEVIARMHYLGKFKQSLYKLKVKSVIQPSSGESLADIAGNHQGILVTVALDESDPEKIYQALATIQDSASTASLYLNGNIVYEVQKV